MSRLVPYVAGGCSRIYSPGVRNVNTVPQTDGANAHGSCFRAYAGETAAAPRVYAVRRARMSIADSSVL